MYSGVMPHELDEVPLVPPNPKTETTMTTCASCRFYIPSEGINGAGACHGLPPTAHPVMNATWPTVRSDSAACSLHKPQVSTVDTKVAGKRSKRRTQPSKAGP